MLDSGFWIRDPGSGIRERADTRSAAPPTASEPPPLFTATDPPILILASFSLRFSKDLKDKGIRLTRRSEFFSSPKGNFN